MRFWLIAAAIALAGAVVGHFLKRRLCGILAGICAAVSAGLYLYVKLFVHHNGLGAGLAVSVPRLPTANHGRHCKHPPHA